jgi:hypothetical protein
LLILMFSVVALGCVVLVFHVLDKVYLDAGFNENVAVGVFFIALVCFYLGGMLCAYVFGTWFFASQWSVPYKLPLFSFHELWLNQRWAEEKAAL